MTKLNKATLVSLLYVIIASIGTIVLANVLEMVKIYELVIEIAIYVLPILCSLGLLWKVITHKFEYGLTGMCIFSFAITCLIFFPFVLELQHESVDVHFLYTLFSDEVVYGLNFGGFFGVLRFLILLFIEVVTFFAVYAVPLIFFLWAVISAWKKTMEKFSLDFNV